MKRNFGKNLEKIVRRTIPLVLTATLLTFISPGSTEEANIGEEPISVALASEITEEDSRIGYEPLVEFEVYKAAKLAPKNSEIGRIQRTLPWEPLYRAIEELEFGEISQNTLAGMIMEESYGDLFQLNSKNDGGMGLVHTQRKTAKDLGRKVFGVEPDSTTSNRGKLYSDTIHGKELKQMLEDCNYDPGCVQEKDDRGNPILNLIDATRIVNEGRRKYGNYSAGVQYFNTTAKVGQSRGLNYLSRVRKWRDISKDPKWFAKASQDFYERNGYPFGWWLEAMQEMNKKNWQLQRYIDMKSSSHFAD